MSIESLQAELNQIRSDIAELTASLPAADSAIAKRKIEIADTIERYIKEEAKIS